MGFSAEALADTDIAIDTDISEVVADDAADKKLGSPVVNRPAHPRAKGAKTKAKASHQQAKAGQAREFKRSRKKTRTTQCQQATDSEAKGSHGPG